jgi:hypothetical protein
MNELQVTTNELWTHEWKFMWMNSIHHITMSNIDINDKFQQWLCDETRWLCITWTSVCLVAEGHCEVPRGCLYFYSLFFTAMDALPCPALPLHYPAFAPALPCFDVTFCCQWQEEEVTQGMGSVFFSFCCQGQEKEVT